MDNADIERTLLKIGDAQLRLSVTADDPAKCLMALEEMLHLIVQAIDQTSGLSSFGAQESSALARRSVEDFVGLLGSVSQIGKTMLSLSSIDRLIALRGTEQDVMLDHLQLMSTMDMTLSKILLLMQYAAEEPLVMDMDSGFILASGAMTYARMPFGSKY